MENEDDMLVVIVGDEDDEENKNEFSKIKTEVFEDEEDYQYAIENIIGTAETNGEVIPIEDIFTKDEPPDYNYLEENIKAEIKFEYDDEDMDYIPEEEDEEEEEYDANEENSDIEVKTKQRYTMVKPWQRKSFVKELRQQYPELRADKKSLIKTLSEIMKTVKPPPPPLDYYILNGIMLECLHCQNLSETIPAAGRHYQEKHGPRYLICYACGVDFRSTTNLYKHEKRCNAPDANIVLKARALCLGRNGKKRPYPPMLSSKPTQKFSCEQCSAEFISKNSLQAHEYMHMGLRPYQCSYCPSAYTSRSTLSRHMKKHSNVQYICDYCQRVFKVKAALGTHMNTHKPEKQFPCSECSKRYAQKFALQLHVDRCHRHLPPPCACHVCPKRFRRTSVLKEHMKRVHGMELITRKMFFRTLPGLTSMQLKNAKIVLKGEEALLANTPPM